MKRVLLVTPPTNATKQVTPDLGIGFLASAMRNAGYEADFIDVRRDALSRAAFIDRVKAHPYPMVGVKVFSTALAEANEVLAAIRQAAPGVKIVIGGPHPTHAPEGSLVSCPDADVAVIGEGDAAIVELARRFESGESLASVESVAYRENGAITVNARRSFMELDALPLPAWDLMDPRLYRDFEDLWYFSMGDLTAPVTVGRGCPFKCTFCSDFIVSGKNVRYRKVESVIAEIELLVSRYGVDEIHLTDSIFTINKKYVYEFANTLVRKNIKIHWATPYGTRLDTLDADLLRAMEDSGCYGTSVGIESGTERMMRFIKKQITPQLVEEKLALIKSTTDFLVQGFFILGYPTETRETMQATIDFACRLPLDMAVFAPFRATPGTEIARYLEENEPEFKPDWVNQTVESLLYSPRGIPAAEMEQWHRKAYRAFYFRPATAFRFLRMIRGKRELSLLARKFKSRIFRKTGAASGSSVWAAV